MSPEMQRLMAERAQRDAAPTGNEIKDELLDALIAAAPQFDRAWAGQGIQPSVIKEIRYCMLMSTGNPEATRCASELARKWLREARPQEGAA